MAIKNIYTGKVAPVVSTRVKPNAVPPLLSEPPGGLFPLRLSAWQMDEFRLRNGWPVEVPNYDIRARTDVSCQGEVLALRDTARGLKTGALVRWVADDELYDPINTRWDAVEGEMPLPLLSSADYLPDLITDYEYLIGNERFVGTAVNFDSNSYEHMWTDLSLAIGGAIGYTVLLVGNMNSVFGNLASVPYAGLWCPGQPTPAIGQPITEAVDPTLGWFSLTLQGSSLYLETEQTPRANVMSIKSLLDATAPVMIAIVFGRPYARIYAGKGPSGITSATVFTGGNYSPLSGGVVVGRENGDILHTADMALMDLAVFNTQLNQGQIYEQFSLLSGVYGGDR